MFLLSGFWHGAGWTFVLWGVLHGAFMVITRWKKDFFERLPAALGWLITFVFANVTWVIFRADTISDALALLGQIFNFNLAISADLVSCFNPTFYVAPNSLQPQRYFAYFFIIAYFLLAFVSNLCCENAYTKAGKFKPNLINASWTAFLLVLCIMEFAGNSIFLYFGF